MNLWGINLSPHPTPPPSQDCPPLSFFPFLSTYLLVLFSLLYSPVGTLLQFCFPVCSLIRFVLVDIIFGFLCSPGQSIVLYFCWTVLILLMDVCVQCIFSHTFYCYKPLLLCWAFAVLWSFPFFFLLPFIFFPLFYNFKFFKPIVFFSTFIPLFSFSSVLFPLQLIFNVYKSSHLPLFNFAYLFFLSFLFFLFSQHTCQFYFHCFIPQLTPCSQFVFHFVLQLVLF